MTTLKVGDTVEVLDDAITGTITAIALEVITIETTDGFVLQFRQSEVIKSQKQGSLLNSTSNQELKAAKLLKESERKRLPLPKIRVKGEIPPAEYDLHIEKLTKNYKLISSYEKLAIQSERAKRIIESAIEKRTPKIVLIHGVGEGVLKAELDFLLGRYDNVTFRDANYQKYGEGATEVSFKYK